MPCGGCYGRRSGQLAALDAQAFRGLTPMADGDETSGALVSGGMMCDVGVK